MGLRWLACWLLLAACAAPPTAGYECTDGRRVDPLARSSEAVHVLVFTSAECPIANGYAPTLRALAEHFAERPVRWFLVHVEPDLDLATAAAHARDYELPGSVLLDPRHALAVSLGVTRTPEAVVLGPGGLVYRGRIDDQYASLAARRPAAATHDLADAIDVALAGGVVQGPHPAAVGCLLPEPRR